MIRRRHLMTAVAAVALLSGEVVAQTSSSQPPSPPGTSGLLAIRDARIVTVSGPTIERGTVVVQNGRILSVGATVPIPSGAEIIDGEGLEVYPGFFDAMSQLGLTEIGAVNATNDLSETGAYNPQIAAATAIHPASDHLPVARVNGITHAIAAPGVPTGAFGSGPVIGGQASAFSLDGWTIEEMLIERSVGMVVNWPSVAASTFDMSTFSRRARPYAEAKQEQARQLHELTTWITNARGYGETRGKAADRVPRDLKLEALAPYVTGSRPWLVNASSERDIKDAVGYFVDTHKLKMVLVGAAEAWKVASLLAEKQVPVVLGPTQALPESDDDPYDATMAAPAALHKAGVTFALSTYNSSDARNLPYEIGTAVGFGLPKDVALQAITLAPARIFGLDAEVGSIEPGKLANLVITNGDPLEIRTEVRHVVIKGVAVPLETRHTRLYEKYRSRPKPATK
jgi:imidazolonepropionase-like amidohydrolase